MYDIRGGEKMKIPTFPQVIFIKVEREDSDGTDYMLPSTTKAETLDGLNPVRIGVYKFVETRSARSADESARYGA